jgi:hypothetical protein
VTVRVNGLQGASVYWSGEPIGRAERSKDGEMNGRIFRRLALAVLTSATAGVIAAPAAAGVTAGDTTPPSVTIDAFTHYVVGTTVDLYYSDPNQLEEFRLLMAVKWRATDPLGICNQTITQQTYETLGGPTDPILGAGTSTSSLSPAVRVYQFGTGRTNYWRGGYRFVVRATDCAGNTSASGVAQASIDVIDDISDAFTYPGRWDVAHFSGFAGGTTHFTSTRGAAAAFIADGGALALVMEKAPNRGSAQIFVDGVLKATVNTNSASTQHRQVVWQGLLPEGQHLVEVVNLASAGHPRIDLDAVLR